MFSLQTSNAKMDEPSMRLPTKMVQAHQVNESESRLAKMKVVGYNERELIGQIETELMGQTERELRGIVESTEMSFTFFHGKMPYAMSQAT